MEKKLFAKNSKSFYFGSLFFSKEYRNNMALVYSFFRVTDDIVDERQQIYYKEMLRFSKTISNFKNNNDCKQWCNLNVTNTIHKKVYQNYFNYIHKYNVSPVYYNLIFEGYKTDRLIDMKKYKIDSLEKLIHYCFRVAGSVAIILCHSIPDYKNIKNKRDFLWRVTSIAIGFQLTNISRDIVTDSKMDRIYIPWMKKEHKKKLLKNKLNNKIILNYAKQIIKIADKYYYFGLSGLNLMHPSVKKGYSIFFKIYREI